MSNETKPSTTLTDQDPTYVQRFSATRTEWGKIYKAIPSRDESGICGEIDAATNGHDFDAEVEIEAFLFNGQVETLIAASIRAQTPLTYGEVRRLICNCGRAGCCLREATS